MLRITDAAGFSAVGDIISINDLFQVCSKVSVSEAVSEASALYSELFEWGKISNLVYD